MKKKKRNLARRILTILLTALVVSTALPAGTFAEELQETPSWTVEELPAAEAETFSLEQPEEIPVAEEVVQENAELPANPYADTNITPEQLHSLNFHSKRILVGTNDPGIFVDPSVVVSSFRNTYLLQFPDEATARAAYAYYFERADFIEVDTGIEAAQPEEALQVKDDTPVVTETYMTGDVNPFKELQAKLDEDNAIEEMALANGEEPEQPVYDIALIDTGVPADAGVDAISLIGEDPVDDNGHGSNMLARIREQNPEASVLSIKALGADGKGDVSAVYAAMEYAIEKNVRIINLSMSAVASPDNCILEQAVMLAKEKGIAVVGAAGNNGKDAGYYIPGSIADAWIIGACDENGVRLANSNYGETVDLNIAAGSTSDAAALFSGWLSIYGEDAVPSALGQGLLFAAEIQLQEEDENTVPEQPEDGKFQTSATVRRTGVSKLTGYKYVVDSQHLYLEDAVLTPDGSSAAGSWVKGTNAPSRWEDGTQEGWQVWMVSWSGTFWGAGVHAVPTGFYLRWADVVHDAQGNSYDLQLHFYNIAFETIDTMTGPFMAVCNDSDPHGQYPDRKNGSTGVLDFYNQTIVGQSAGRFHASTIEMSMQILQPGTNTPCEGNVYYGVRDLDQPDYYHYFTWGGEAGHQDIGIWYTSLDPDVPNPYTEGIELLTPVNSDVFVESNTILNINAAGTKFWGSRGDSDTWQSGLVLAADPSNFAIRWSGTIAGTPIFQGLPGNYKINAWVEGDPAGGTISPEGITGYYAGENGNYTMTPDPNWEIEYVKVDGVTIPNTSTYNFTNIQADHTICVKYRRITGDLKLTNEMPNGTLKVTKNVTGTGADASKAFTFTATTLGNAGTYKKYNADDTQVASGAGSGDGTSLAQGGTFTLSGGQYILLSLPAGTQYVITETADVDYDTSESPVSGTIKANRNFTYSVNIKNGSTNVSGLEMPYTGSKSGTLTTNSSGNATVKLSGGQNVTITNIPTGYTYTVTQTAVSGFDVTPANRKVSGTKTTDVQTAAFSNTPSQVSATVTNTYHGLGSHYTLAVKKNVTGNMGNRAQTFHFHMTLSKPNVNLNNAVITYRKTLQNGTVQTGTVTLTNGAYDFTLTHGDQIVFTGIPDKTAYAVTETEANKDQYVTTVPDEASGSLTANTSAQFTNRRQMAVPTKAKIMTIGSIALIVALMAACGIYIVIFIRRKRKGAK